MLLPSDAIILVWYPTIYIIFIWYYIIWYIVCISLGINLENWLLTDKLCILTHSMSYSDWRLLLSHHPQIWNFLVIARNVHSMDDYFPLWQDKHTVSCLKDFAHSKDLKVELQRRWNKGFTSLLWIFISLQMLECRLVWCLEGRMWTRT